jgi:cell division protein ZapA
MAVPTKQIEVQIMGQSYLLGCPEGGEGRLLEAVEKVDTAMCRIRDAGKVKARDRIAVLAALNLAFDVADRGVASARAGTPAPASSGGVPDPRLDALLARLDGALGVDGRLI